MPVNDQHPDYAKHVKKWRRTRAAAGSDVASDEFLPAPFRESEKERYDAYKDRAYFLGVTGRTLKGLTGIARS